jgi:hypothetical protein
MVVVRLGRQILREHKLDSATFAKALDLFGKQGTVELVILMGDYKLNASLFVALMGIVAMMSSGWIISAIITAISILIGGGFFRSDAQPNAAEHQPVTA